MRRRWFLLFAVIAGCGQRLALDDEPKPSTNNDPDASTSAVTDGSSSINAPDAPEEMDAGPCKVAAFDFAESLQGFRSQQGACGWEYRFARYADVQATYPSEPLVWGGDRWVMPAPGVQPPVQIRAAFMHPGTDYVAIRRWKSTLSGTIRVNGSIELDDDPGKDAGKNGTRLRVSSPSNPDKLLATIDSNAPKMTFFASIEVIVGDDVDFILDSRGEAGNDTTEYYLTIMPGIQ